MKALKILDDKIEAGYASIEDRDSRIKLHEIDKLYSFEAMDTIQNARIKWDVEGDENSKFFLSLINKKCKNNSIDGIIHEGEWVTDPHQIKEVFLDFSKQKFQANDSLIDFSSTPTSSRLNDCDRALLEANVSMDEIKVAVWGCGGEKALGPDGVHYKIIAKVLANRLSKVVDKIVSHEQTTFIVNRQILDGPLILSEALYLVSWRYLDFMLCNLGFGLTWRSWIEASLKSSQTSILVNGSLTSEFNVRRGLRQGDPLSPFLFIIIMEGLHVALSNSVRNGLIRDINIGSSNINLSHLFFADDVVITTDWCNHNLENIIRIFKVFYLALGLKINIHKSSIYGIGVSSEDVHLASTTGCRGLAISSLKFFNLALLHKWRWRFYSNPDSLWVKVIRALHGREGGFDHNGCKYNGLWSKIFGTSNYLHSSSILHMDSISISGGLWLFHLEREKDFLVMDRISNGQWEWNWSRSILGVL
ncbi:putative RNA-directed DNA polymerase, eukaryota, reverse transcriptase zinc-binding domain protein [Tanacetum coccineum]